ncbi:MAG: BON domain-containing protein [Planctomycetes bacterium]|nr:BON domain-containing protein [Planctomycetota bacterium]
MSTVSSVLVCREAQAALDASPLFDLRSLVVEEETPGTLAIRGMVGSFYHKQLAQEAVRAVAKSLEYRVVNYVEVMDTLIN